MPGLLKISSTLNPMAAEFKLNPTASEFVPNFGSCLPSANTEVTSEFNELSESNDSKTMKNEVNEAKSCATIVDQDPSTILTPLTNTVEKESPCANTVGEPAQPQQDHKDENLFQKSKACFGRTLPKIVSGECLADMELEFNDMILDAPCDESPGIMSRDDSNPLQDWCGDEPPKLVWSRSADMDLLPELTEESPDMEHNVDKTSANEESSESAELVVPDATATPSTEAPKSKVTVDDFEILCKVGEVRGSMEAHVCTQHLLIMYGTGRFWQGFPSAQEGHQLDSCDEMHAQGLRNEGEPCMAAFAAFDID